MEKEKRYKVSMGLAFNEDREMEMLSNMAKDGWIFYSYSNLGYKFKRGEPKDLIYCVDIYPLKKTEEEQYFNLFRDGGWDHVCSAGNTFHFFAAPPKTKPIYTDRETSMEKYIKGRKQVFKAVIVLGAIFLALFFSRALIDEALDNEAISLIIDMIAGGSLGLLSALIITGLVLGLRIKNIKHKYMKKGC